MVKKLIIIDIQKDFIENDTGNNVIVSFVEKEEGKGEK